MQLKSLVNTIRLLSPSSPSIILRNINIVRCKIRCCNTNVSVLKPFSEHKRNIILITVYYKISIYECICIGMV